jgi:hypothetical protein
LKEKEIKTSHDEQKVTEFMTTEQVRQKVLKGNLHTEVENKCNHEHMGVNKFH